MLSYIKKKNTYIFGNNEEVLQLLSSVLLNCNLVLDRALLNGC